MAGRAAVHGLGQPGPGALESRRRCVWQRSLLSEIPIETPIETPIESLGYFYSPRPRQERPSNAAHTARALAPRMAPPHSGGGGVLFRGGVLTPGSWPKV